MTAGAAPGTKQARLAAILARAPILPVVTIDAVDDALPLARALAAGGIGAIEITLRTAAGIAAIRAVAAELPAIAVGAGTVLDARQVNDAEAAGARFLVSPGASSSLLDAAERATIPWLPGVATAGEAMALLGRGHRHFKFFPAAAAGGPAWLRAVHAPLPEARFCPTGGVNADNAADYLALPNVACVGGSWLAPRARISAHAWNEIEQGARAALARAASIGRGAGPRGTAP